MKTHVEGGLKMTYDQQFNSTWFPNNCKVTIFSQFV